MATPRKLFEPAIVRAAVGAAFRKLDPRVQVRNPVMFVVLVGSVLVTLRFLVNLFNGGGPGGIVLPFVGIKLIDVVVNLIHLA
jgi:K+-transporting ATPase ATPase B chain